MTNYVVGFLMDEERVALIRAARPEWQAGLLNGIGGKVEPGESGADAMRREFHEETGRDVTGWIPFVVMDIPGGQITFYRRWTASELLDSIKTMTDEEVVISHRNVREPMVANLQWLLPLAAYTGDHYDLIRVTSHSVETPAFIPA